MAEVRILIDGKPSPMQAAAELAEKADAFFPAAVNEIVGAFLLEDVQKVEIWPSENGYCVNVCLFEEPPEDCPEDGEWTSPVEDFERDKYDDEPMALWLLPDSNEVDQ